MEEPSLSRYELYAIDMDVMNCICLVDPVASLFCMAWRKAGFEMISEVTDASFLISQAYGFDSDMQQ